MIIKGFIFHCFNLIYEIVPITDKGDLVLHKKQSNIILFPLRSLFVYRVGSFLIEILRVWFNGSTSPCHGEGTSSILFTRLYYAVVVEWQTRQAKNLVLRGVRVRISPAALYGSIAQQVEHILHTDAVGSSNLSTAIFY